MKGLLKKDISLMVSTGKSYVLIVLFGIILGFINEGMQGFALCFPVILLGLSGISTMSYDDFENGLSFLMILPVSRKVYVLEKYVLCFLTGAAGSVIAVALGMLFFDFRLGGENGDWLIEFFMTILLLMVFMIAPMIPARFKLGPEKYKVVNLVMVAVVWIVVMAGKEILEAFHVDAAMLVQRLDSLPGTVILLGVFVIYAVIMAASYLGSVHILQKKEF